MRMPYGRSPQRFSEKLDHNPVERTEDFTGTVGYGNRFAPSIGFGNAKRMLSQDVRSDILGSADRQQRQNVWVRIDLLNRGRIVSHGSLFTPLRILILDFGF